MRARTTSAHEIPARIPIQLGIGEPVVVGERDTEWPEFVFVTTGAGSGWVPARHLSADSGAAVVEEPYDTTELEVAAGEEVTVVARDDDSGWWWCRADSGREGWVPTRAFKKPMP